ncbi:fimbrial biogenesis outer membrane usher protein [Burkholderia sp. Ac-20345]|uniref:fimbria/pilus outer membrane usher protein n=1 Tax=Burkholderia sp. Ac-20345 TaxID=2703891 RepID=UPI00197B93B4|nr:fimbrial biogenesis outer membrane usher protein [Burkholderia sp. Ac-20345]
MPGLLPVASVHAADFTDGPAIGQSMVVADNYQPALLVVDINQQGHTDTLLAFRSSTGEPWLAQDDLQRLRLRVPERVPVILQGKHYYPVSALPGATYRLDEASQSLSLVVNPDAFVTTQTSLAPRTIPAPTPTVPGLFANYDVFADRSAGTTTEAGSFEFGAFSRLGVGTSSFLLQRGAATSRSLRLESTFTADRPADLVSLRIGDAVTRNAALWGRAVRFGGLQYATNFATQPGFVTMPLQSFAGQAALPSTVDVYVNSVLATSKNVPPGPLSINELPVVTGQGDVQLVVKDALGREQVISQRFYASGSLLRPGLKDFSAELGAIRRNYGLSSLDYGPVIASATYRQGLNDAFTGEAHIELEGSSQATMGLGCVALVPWLGVFTVAGAVSRRGGDSGQLWALGFERRGAIFSAAFQTLHASERFQQLGYDANALAPRRQSTASFGVSSGRYGSINLAWLSRAVSGQTGVSLVNLSYTLQIHRVGMLSVTTFRTLNGQPERTLSVGITLPLGGVASSASVTQISSRGAADQSIVQFQRNLPAGSGYGYRVQAAHNAPQQASLYLQNDIGTYTLEAAQYAGRSAARAGMSGGVVVLGGSTFLSRRIDNSVGLVQLPGLSGVRIYADNQLVAYTDKDGNALLPALRAYDDNPVRIEQQDLPWDTEIGSLTTDVVPYFRSGVLIHPPVRRTNSAMLRLVTADGRPLPAGTEVGVNEQTEQFPVAMDGAVFVNGLNATNRLNVRWDGRRCEAMFAFNRTAEPIQNLGEIVCKEARP